MSSIPRAASVVQLNSLLGKKAFREIALDIVAALMAVISVFALSTQGQGQFVGLPQFALYALACVSQVGIMYSLRIYSLNHRYLGFYDVALLGVSTVFPATVLTFAQHQYHVGGKTTGAALIFVLYCFASTTYLTGLRLYYRHRLRRVGSDDSSRSGRRVRTLIVGAGDAGDAVLREFERNQKSTASIVGFIDDDPSKRSLRIRGVPVLGGLEDVADLVDRFSVDEILVAIPVASGPQMRRVFDLCGRTSARVKTLPGLQDITGSKNSLTRQLREIRIEDLLRREPVPTDLRGIGEYIRDQNVLITGGGGSIGSELARQVVRMRPRSLILVGKGENSLYEIQQELIQTSDFVPITVVADVKDAHSMNKIFRDYRPSVVFHAAAHKHVPLMERNVLEAVKNNVLGTLNCADLAVRYNVAKFILISTDKAVAPSNVMGATKRLCEMVVCAFKKASSTQFAVVRFGNVLGSRGSLIPLLTAQIKRGGPVTVTHPEMTRFFMTIPEAVQLVLQAGALGGGQGDIFILDMGEPVKIEELALELIRLHGLMPGDDIAVKYTGIRPGEKLHEELVYANESILPTAHPKIRTVEHMESIDIESLKGEIGRLVSRCMESDHEAARKLLMDLVGRTDYNQVIASISEARTPDAASVH